MREILWTWPQDTVVMVFYEYHRQFSDKAAAHLKFQGIPVDWSIRNNTLFCNIFANHKPVTCFTCNSTFHTSAFCPLARQGIGHRFVRSNEIFKKTDLYGRQRHMFGGLEICNNFNSDRDCSRPRCNNVHVCFYCKKSDHAKSKCPNQKNLQPPPQGTVKTLVNGQEVEYTPSCINVAKLESYLQGHNDYVFVDKLLQGLCGGFDTGFKRLPSNSIECNNLLSTRTLPEVTSSCIQTELNKGFLIGPYKTIPYDRYRINPIGIVESKYSKKEENDSGPFSSTQWR